MKNLEEIDCNESLWEELRNNSNNGWGQTENQLTFIYQTKSKLITEDDIHDALYDKFPTADTITVTQEFPTEKEKNMRYFLAGVTIYNSGI